MLKRIGRVLGELLVVFAWLACRFVAATCVGVLLGVFGGVAAVVYGAGPRELLMLYAVVLLGSLGIGLAVWLVAPLLTGRPEWPACAGCGEQRYRAGWVMARVVALCPCGSMYLRRGRQFLALTDGGASRPYLRWAILRWVDERGAADVPCCAPYRDDRGGVSASSASCRPCAARASAGAAARASAAASRL